MLTKAITKGRKEWTEQRKRERPRGTKKELERTRLSTCIELQRACSVRVKAKILGTFFLYLFVQLKNWSQFKQQNTIE